MLACHKCPLQDANQSCFWCWWSYGKAHVCWRSAWRTKTFKANHLSAGAGQLLTKIIEAIGWKRSDVYIANVLKCRPPETAIPFPEEIVLCMPYLIKQIKTIQPKVLGVLGTFAAQTLLNTKAPVGTLRANSTSIKECSAMVTYHPAYLPEKPQRQGQGLGRYKKVRILAGELSGKDSKI